MAKKTSNRHVCSECIEDFEPKKLFVAQKHNAFLPHTTLYCEKCIKELGITEYTPYHKSRVTKTNNSETETDKPKTTRKTTAKTKTGTTAKTKKTTAKKTTATKTKTTSTRSKK